MRKNEPKDLPARAGPAFPLNCHNAVRAIPGAMFLIKNAIHCADALRYRYYQNRTEEEIGAFG